MIVGLLSDEMSDDSSLWLMVRWDTRLSTATRMNRVSFVLHQFCSQSCNPQRDRLVDKKKRIIEDCSIYEYHRNIVLPDKVHRADVT